MSMEHITDLVCVQCGKMYDTSVPYTCPDCGIDGIIDIKYDYDRVRSSLTAENLAERPLSLWRYRELLPVAAEARRPLLQVGMTPIYDVPSLSALARISRLLIKDDGRNPTGSFKDRASAIGVTKAAELGVERIACASTGNAASSLAGFSAAMGLPATIFVPERAPEPKVAQLLIFGAQVFKVRGSYDDAYYLCQDACARWGWYNRNCAVNPYLIEGKKTVGLEIAESLGEKMVDWVCFSVGDGCTIAGAWKGLKEMHELGFIARLPRMLGVQAEGSAPIYQAWKNRADLIAVEADTVADSIAVGKPRNWRKVLNTMKESDGHLLTVSDKEILDRIPVLAQNCGVFAEPAGITAFAGVLKAVEEKIIQPEESVLIVITGNGLKDVKSAMKVAPDPITVAADLGALEEYVQGD